MELIIVSGLSGSGKSIALSTLEDCGYYCIDNLPVRLIEPFVREFGSQPGKTAISIDCRNLSGDIDLFCQVLEIFKQFTIPYRILFLKAAPQILLNRYSETRRKHPLSHTADLPPADAIQRENALLEPIAAQADLMIDTSHTNIHQLRELVRARLGEKDSQQLSLCFTSFGFKQGIPLDADFIFDARCLPNPHWEPKLRPLTGRDRPVAEYLQSLPLTGAFLTQVQSFLDHWLPHFRDQNRSYLTVAIGCTGGQHRSVYLAEKLGDIFASSPYSVLVRHRELP
ncbi:MAG: RNase adapter RapZ [Methylohalobius sp. ZOD2]